MSRKEASAALVGFVMEGLTAERDVLSLADSRALGGASPAFSPQLWKSVGLAPKLMGVRREQFLQDQGIGLAPPPPEGLDVLPPVTIVTGSSRSARAVQRACRQRFSCFQDAPEMSRGPKDLKAAAIAEFQGLVEKREKMKSPSSERLNSASAGAKSPAKRVVAKDRPSVAPVMLGGKDAEARGADSKPASRGSQASKRASDSAVETHMDERAAASDDGSPGLCLHCMETLGARPLLSCFECQQVMHFDCYSDWAGAEPGPWDNVHCPAHKPVKKPRHRPGSTCTSPRAGVARKPSMDLGSKLSVLATRPDAKDAFSRPTTPRGNFSPSSSDMTHDTHHSPSRSEATHHAKSEQMAVSPKAGVKRPPAIGDSKDEELAMRLHRELNAAPTRRRRGDA